MTCKHIFSSDEGTSHCTLAGVTADQWQAMKTELNQLRAERGWQDISTAPKNGDIIYIMNPAWDNAPKAKWGEYPDNPVEGENGEVYMQGWLIEDSHFCAGCEDGFLGWNEDIDEGNMPTHWQPLPDKLTRTEQKEGA